MVYLDMRTTAESVRVSKTGDLKQDERAASLGDESLFLYIFFFSLSLFLSHTYTHLCVPFSSSPARVYCMLISVSLRYRILLFTG